MQCEKVLPRDIHLEILATQKEIRENFKCMQITKVFILLTTDHRVRKNFSFPFILTAQ